MPIERVNFTTYAPDVLSNNPAILDDGASVKVATDKTVSLGTYNAVPTLRGYKNLVSPTEQFTNPDGGSLVVGAYIGIKPNGDSKLFAGTTTKLFAGDLASKVWTPVTRNPPDGVYAAGNEKDRWHFAQFGDYTIAVKASNHPQVNDGDDEFEDLGGTPPTQAKYVAVANNFVILANLEGSANGPTANKEASVWISGFGKHNYWTPNDQNLSEFFSLIDTPGEIVGIKALGRDVYVYKTHATHFLNFTGTGWTNSLVSTQAGALSNDAVVDIGERHVSMGYDNFYAFQSGGGSATLENPLYEKIFGPNGDLDRSAVGLVQGRYDKELNVVFWHYPSTSRDTDTNYCDRWVAWAVDTERWAAGEAAVRSVVYPYYDTNAGETYTSFGNNERLRNNTDKPLWNTNFKTSVGADDEEGTLTYADPTLVGIAGYASGFFDDYAKLQAYVHTVDQAAGYVPAMLQTGDFGDGVVYKFVRGIRPRFEGPVALVAPSPAAPVEGNTDLGGTSLASCTVFRRDDLNTELTNVGVENSSAVLDGDSPRWFTFRSNGRYHRFVFFFAGGAELSGFDIDYDDAGTR